MAPTSGRGRTRRGVPYLIQSLPVGLWQVLGLVVSHGPLTHHLEVEGPLQDPRISALPTHLQDLRRCHWTLGSQEGSQRICLFVCLEAGSHVAQAGLKVIMYLRLALNFWSSCPNLSSIRIKAFAIMPNQLQRNLKWIVPWAGASAESGGILSVC